MDAALFTAYAEQYLAPSLSGGDIVIMDNLASHKAKAAFDAIESVGASVWFLPAYSPDLAPRWTLPSSRCGARSRHAYDVSPRRRSIPW